MTTTGEAGPQPQPVATGLTSAAIFLVLSLRQDAETDDAVRGLFGDIAGIRRSVGFRDPGARLSCVTGIGARLWDRLFGAPKPAGLHPFRELRAEGRHAVATHGDLLFHLRATRMDMCFELATHLTNRLAGAIAGVEEVQGFRYFDNRDLLGFVDGTENPEGDDAAAATLIGAEDPDFAGGSYVITQKYLHDMAAWNALTVAEQEAVIGREKLSDIELSDDVKPASAHNALTSITDENGDDIDILRDNMPFGSIADGEFGTYFIGYARSPDPIERMLRNMFLGDPPGNYDRILDFSRAVTGSLFFVPSVPLLESLADRTPGASADTTQPAGRPAGPPVATGDGSLRIGSLRGASQHE